MRCEIDRQRRNFGSAPALLIWAVRTLDPRKFVHIGMLGKSENGAACGCVCRACGEPMLAVNVDKAADHFDKPGAQRPHFKHRHTSPDESRCQRKIAQLLALQLYVEQQMIYLPALRRQISRIMPNGKTVTAGQLVPQERVAVRSHAWVDDLSAILLLDDGRELLVTIRALHTVDERSRSTCVLSLAGLANPVIAGWTTKEILDHLQMPENGMGWVRHWNDGMLESQEAAALAQTEDIFLGGIPREWLEDLDGKQFNETVLHWLIKKTIEEQGLLEVPEMKVAVARRMPDGTRAQETAHWPGMLLRLEDIRLEKRLGNMVPDILCRARQASAPGPVFDLIIEAAVTHYIDEEKRQKLCDAGIACIEIRADLFAKAGNVPVAEIQKMVCADDTVKQWIVHPWIDHAIAGANSRLADRGAGVQRRMNDEARKRHAEEMRKDREARQLAEQSAKIAEWAAVSPDKLLVRGYQKLLRIIWADATSYLPRQPAGTHQRIWNELVRRDIVSDNQRAAIENRYGLVHTLLRVHGAPWNTIGHLTLERFRRSVEDFMSDASEALVLMWALESRRSLMTADEASAFNTLRQTLRSAVDTGSSKYQRNTQNDRLLGLLAPDILPALQSGYGTPAHFVQLRTEREYRERVKNRRDERLNAVESGRKAQARKVNAAAVQRELQAVTRTLSWRSFPFGDPNPVQLYAKYNHLAQLHGVSALDLLRQAAQHWKSGATVDKALASMAFNDPRNIGAAANLLIAAGLCARPGNGA